MLSSRKRFTILFYMYVLLGLSEKLGVKTKSKLLLSSRVIENSRTYCNITTTYEPCHEKTNILVSDRVLHKLGCTATEQSGL